MKKTWFFCRKLHQCAWLLRLLEIRDPHLGQGISAFDRMRTVTVCDEMVATPPLYFVKKAVLSGMF